MKKRYLFVALLVLGACTTPKYVLTTNLENHRGSSTVEGQITHSAHYAGGGVGAPTYTYHNYTDTKDTSLKPLLIPVEAVENDGFWEFKAFVHLCNKGKFNDARKILEAYDFKNKEIEVYLESLFLFMKKKNKDSLEKITTIEPSLLPLHFELLKLDIEYELKKDRQFQKQYFIQKYQAIIDSFELDEIQLDLIKTRIKSLRYS